MERKEKRKGERKKKFNKTKIVAEVMRYVLVVTAFVFGMRERSALPTIHGCWRTSLRGKRWLDLYLSSWEGKGEEGAKTVSVGEGAGYYNPLRMR